MYCTISRSIVVELKPYTMASRDDALKNGQCVLVSIYGNWDANTANALRWLSDDVTLQIRRRNMLAMSGDWSNHKNHVTALMKELDVKSVPVLVVFDPKKPNTPTVLNNLPDEKQVLGVSDSCCR